jgi:hypothetical protein
LGTPPENDKDYWNVDGMAMDRKQYCKCEAGFHGFYCEISSGACGNEGELCFHDSKCIQSVVNGKTLHHCDCRDATTETASYAGRYCQYKATSYCDKGDGELNGHLFCVNGGTCQEDAYLGCICPEGFRGFSCEYYVGDDSNDPGKPPLDDVEDTVCSLDCNGRGSCRDDIKDKPTDEVVGSAEHLTEDAALSSEAFEHCVCQAGWTGLQCDVKATKCGGGGYHCFQGSECYTAGNEQKCDCSTANSTELGTAHFAGEQCEHPASEICTEDGKTNHYNPSKELSFCVNYGICKAEVKEGDL